MSPRVTVLMPVFNREEFVGEAIQGLLAQDFADFELLVGSLPRDLELRRAA
jgi:glycosyltransferase involved in cell wall biosynthesis